MIFKLIAIAKSRIKHARNWARKISFSSESYWRNRYAKGGTSGPGSYDHLAQFKADVLNDFVANNSIQSVIEFGCGDGNQLKLANYPFYKGYDISSEAVALCKKHFNGDVSKYFDLVKNYKKNQADLAISLDVIFHLVEDNVFDQYMYRLFSASSRFVAIYSSNMDKNTIDLVSHVKHRNFMKWIAKHRPEWELIKTIENKYSYNGDYTNTSFSNFYFYGQRTSS